MMNDILQEMRCSSPPRSEEMHPLTEKIRFALFTEVEKMSRISGVGMDEYPAKVIMTEADEYLRKIAELLNSNGIYPWTGVVTDENAERRMPDKAVTRVGFFPVTANPFHWAHLLVGLKAVAEHSLDRMIFVIAWDDSRKPDMGQASVRHMVAREVLSIFSPLFKYSGIARGTGHDGETNLFRLLSLNQDRKIEAFYIAGADHCRRVDPRDGSADTIQKIEDNCMRRLYGFDPGRHSVTPLFVSRGGCIVKESTYLEPLMMNGTGFDASSTMIREALAGNGPASNLILMPYTAFYYSRHLGLYDMIGTPIQK